MDFDWSKLDRLDELMATGTASSLASSKQALGEFRTEITTLLTNWTRTSEAQAEAVVTSAMLTSELERTQAQLRDEVAVRKRAEVTFQSLLRLTSSATGTSYFKKLATGLADALGPTFILVAQIDGLSAHTLAVWSKGKIASDFCYELEGTPCAQVGRGVTCRHHADVQTLFPDDHLLKEMGIESYLGVPLRAPDGTIRGLIVVLDTQPREDLEQATEIVELFADRASVELLRMETDMHLVEAKEAAEDASRSKSSFLAMISHEIRTPLNGILGMTSMLLLDPSLSAEHRGLIDTTHRSGQVLLRVLNDVLDFSKMEAGELEIVHDAFDPEQLVEEVVALYDHRSAPRSLSCVAWAEASVPALVSGDESRIRQVLGNLVGNATKFTSSGEVCVVVRGTGDGTTLEFEVRDTGIGIDERALRKIFEPFSQADGSMSRQFGGTGLGLSISRQLIEMMGGEIGVESELGKGSRFWFRLPLEPVDAAINDAARMPLQTWAAIASDTSALNGRRVLLVEDNPVNSAVATRMLERLGCEVEVAGNGLESLEHLEAADFDVILMDCQMPIMDGFEATERIRQSQATEPRSRRSSR